MSKTLTYSVILTHLKNGEKMQKNPDLNTYGIYLYDATISIDKNVQLRK